MMLQFFLPLPACLPRCRHNILREGCRDPQGDQGLVVDVGGNVSPALQCPALPCPCSLPFHSCCQPFLSVSQTARLSKHMQGQGCCLSTAATCLGLLRQPANLASLPCATPSCIMSVPPCCSRCCFLLPPRFTLTRSLGSTRCWRPARGAAWWPGSLFPTLRHTSSGGCCATTSRTRCRCG